jgi:hypothetical protein
MPGSDALSRIAEQVRTLVPRHEVAARIRDAIRGHDDAALVALVLAFRQPDLDGYVARLLGENRPKHVPCPACAGEGSRGEERIALRQPCLLCGGRKAIAVSDKPCPVCAEVRAALRPGAFFPCPACAGTTFLLKRKDEA